MTAAPTIAKTDDLSRPEWLAARRQGIGGSDAAAILGLDPFKTPLAVYLDKRGELPDDGASEAAEWGNRLEPFVADAALDRINTERDQRGLPPVKARRRKAILRHPDIEFMVANIDREIVGHEDGPAILEAKTTGYWSARQWEDDRDPDGPTLPDRYHVQTQHYLAVMGRGHAWLAVLVAGQRLVVEHVERDQALIDALVEVEARFWQQVQGGTPPPATADDSDRVKVLHRDATPGRRIVLPGEVDDLLADYRAAKAARKAAETRQKAVEARIRQLLGDAEEGALPGSDRWAVRCPVITTNRLDTKALRAAHPDIAEEFTRESSYRRLTVAEEA